MRHGRSGGPLLRPILPNMTSGMGMRNSASFLVERTNTGGRAGNY